MLKTAIAYYFPLPSLHYFGTIANIQTYRFPTLKGKFKFSGLLGSNSPASAAACAVCHMSGVAVAVWPGGGTLPLAGDGDGTLPLQSQGSSPPWNRFEVTPAVAVTDRNRLIVTTAATWRVETTRHCAPPSYTTSLCTAAVSGHRRPDCSPVSFLNSCFVFRIDKLELTRCIQKQT